MASPTVDRRFGLVGNTALKAPVLVVATGNITLSGEQTIDGKAVSHLNASGVPDRVLCAGQIDATQNGIYDVSTAAWSRSADADGIYDLAKGTTVFVTDGTANVGSYWQITSDGPITVGTTAVTWTTVLTAVTTAAANAAIATTQAGIATTQAGIATTQAGIATTQAGVATTQATQAGLYAALAATGAKFYDTIALGRAGVADTFTFGVKAGGSDNLTHPSVYRREAAGGQTLLYTINTLSDISTILTSAFGVFNVFNAATVQDNFILANGGSPGAFAGFFVTAFIPVKGGDYITFNANGAPASWGLQFYDANQTYVSTPGSVVANTPAAIPTGVAYVRASFDKTVITAAKLMAVLGQTMLSEYQPFGITSPANILRLARPIASAYRANKRKNLFDPNDVTPNFFIAASTGALTANGSWTVGNFMPVTPGGSITVTNNTGATGMNWYDLNQNFISITNGPFTDGQVLAVPSNAFYARGSWQTATLSSVLVVEGNQGLLNPYYHNVAMQSDLRPWLGKGWLVQGTSIEANVNWFATPAATHGATLTNIARASRDSSHNLYLADNVTLLHASDFTNIDMVYLNTFTNDANGNMTIGTSADSAATASVWGYTRNFFETILGYKPAMRFVLGTPLQRFDGGLGVWPYSRMLAYAQAVRDIAAFWGAPVLDLYNISGFNKTTAVNGAPAALTIDGVHPTTAGYNEGLIKPATAFFYNCLPVA